MSIFTIGQAAAILDIETAEVERVCKALGFTDYITSADMQAIRDAFMEGR